MFINSFLKKNTLKSSISEKYNQNRKKDVVIENLNLKLLKNKEKIPAIEYSYNQIQHLNQIPLLILCKSILVMTDDLFPDIIKITWNLLLNSDQEIASASGNHSNSLISNK